MEEVPILVHVKSFLGIDPDEESFDASILPLISSCLDELNDVNCGNNLLVTKETLYSEFYSEPITFDPEHKMKGMIQTYVNLTVQILFDPPQPSTLNAIKEMLPKFLWRIQMAYDGGVINE